MSLLQNSVQYDSNESTLVVEKTNEPKKNDEMILRVNQIIRHESPMSKKLKLEKRKDSPLLKELLDREIDQKGETNSVEIRMSGNNEFEVDGMTKSTLHSFLLKAEELGKTITYTRTLKVEIND